MYAKHQNIIISAVIYSALSNMQLKDTDRKIFSKRNNE